MVERDELGSGGKGERDLRAEGGVVDLAETTTEGGVGEAVRTGGRWVMEQGGREQ